MRAPRLYYGDPINRAHPAMRSIASRWKVVPWYASGPRLIDLAGRNHGTLTNGPTWSSSLGRPGGFGAIKYDASNDYVVAPFTALVKPFTLASWVYFTTSVATQQCIMSNDDGTTGTGYRYCVGRSGSYLDYVVSSIAGLSFTTLTVATGRWFFTAITANGSTITGFVGDSQGGFKTESGSEANTANAGANKINLGGLGAGTNPLGGYLDDSMAWPTRALSGSEVLALYNATKQQYDPTLSWLRRRSYAFAAGGGGGTTTTDVIGGGCGQYLIAG